MDTIKTKWVGNITTFLNLERDANAQSLEETAPFDPSDIPPPNDNDSVSIITDEMPEAPPVADEEMKIIPLSEADELLDIFE